MHEFDIEYKYGRVLRKRVKRLRPVCICGWKGMWWSVKLFGPYGTDIPYAREEYGLHIQDVKLRRRE